MQVQKLQLLKKQCKNSTSGTEDAGTEDAVQKQKMQVENLQLQMMQFKTEVQRMLVQMLQLQKMQFKTEGAAREGAGTVDEGTYGILYIQKQKQQSRKMYIYEKSQELPVSRA